jgi:uncharacterized protein (DUF885 family)
LRLKACLALTGVVLAVTFLVADGGQSGTARTAALHALFEREWEWELAQDPLSASDLGDTRYNDRWPDLSAAAIAGRQAHREGVLRELAAIPRDQLSPADRIHYDVFRYQTEMRVEGHRHQYQLIRTSTLYGVQNAEQVVDSLTFRSVKDYENWLARLEAFSAYIDQNIALMREGINANVMLPKVIVQRVRGQLDELAAQTPNQSGFFRPFQTMPDGMSSGDRERLTAQARERIRTRVIPAFARLRDFIDKEYAAAAPERVGWSQTGSGQAGYAYFARFHTTTDLTPQQIHDLGLKEVARIRGEMERIKREVRFEGTLADFFTYLRTDPKFFYKTGAELLAAYRAMSKRVDPELVKVTKKLPRVPYGVIPIPDAVAPLTTTAYANSGSADGTRPPYYFVNLYKPETRPKWEMMALTLHEAMPGHCLQLSVAQELGEMPAFRRHSGFTAYTEGWGLYAESLGDEMGVYRDDPYSKFGQLTYEMWRAVRLVVDTGLHSLGWERARAIRYFMDNAAKTEHDVTNEIDRYLSWPGQALAYKVGELKIWELRRKAQAALGEKFDVRDFNDVVLQTGSVPLNVLEQRVNEWLRN